MSQSLDPTSLQPRARTLYRVKPIEVAKVLCHRQKEGAPQFLVLWLTKDGNHDPLGEVASWHGLDELSACLHFVQTYVDAFNLQALLNATAPRESSHSGRLKRKAPGADPSLATSGLLTPEASNLSRSPSVSYFDQAQALPSSTKALTSWAEIDVYNGLLQRREGWITLKKSRKSIDAEINTIDTSTLPTKEMVAHAAVTSAPIKAAEGAIRYAFLEKLRYAENVHLDNQVDSTTPSLDFEFVHDYVLRNGITRLPVDAHEGCQYPCRPDMGANCGCEYTAKCGCLEFAAVDEQAYERRSPDEYRQYRAEMDAGQVVDTTGLPKKFPYKKATAEVPSVLQKFYLEQRYGRYVIYECNANCNCGPGCKSRLVQKGRKVGLTVFKTPDRGWGVKCNERVVSGEFIDIYLGEVITNEEATRREKAQGTIEKASYLYSLDKHVGDEEDLTANTCYLVDGEYRGNLTRFINHSCEPNCRIYTVSYNKHDRRIYYLAFFALEDIQAGQELTFDYMDLDEHDDEVIFEQREKKARDPDSNDMMRCNCGARRCRWFLWE